LQKSVPEHEEMRRLIAALRKLDPADAQYDATFMDLMRRLQLGARRAPASAVFIGAGALLAGAFAVRRALRGHAA
jgi:hypothetical protein